jgi:hypothetical protein
MPGETAQLCPNSHTPIKINEMNVRTEAPDASPSRPSVRLTPLLVAVTMRATHTTTKIAPSVIEVSLTVDS